MVLMDVKRWIWVPCFVVLALAGARGYAAADLSVGASVRSYPLSGVVEGTTGYGLVLYGTEGEPFAGYVRAALDGFTAGTYNSGVAKLEIFPLSILGIRAGGESVQNDADYKAYDCASYVCQGRFYETFVETELTLGYAGFFVQGRWRRERWTEANSTAGDFVEPTSGLLMDTAGESQTVYQGMLGYKWNEKWTTLAGIRYAEDDDGYSQLPFGLLRWKSGGLSIGAGGGSFKSSLKERGPTAIAYLSWEIWPSVKLK
jgi:hypothetical protein